MSLGQALEPVYKELNDTLWDFEATTEEPPGFSEQGFRYAVKIFTSALLEKVWQHQTKLDVPLNKRCVDVEKLGNAIRDLILDNTGIDLHEGKGSE